MSTSIKKYQNVIIIIGVALVAFILGYLSADSSGVSGFSLSGAAGAVASEYCDTTPLSNTDPTGLVLADPLNFRIGPGLSYDIISVLDYCTPISLLGRTDDSAWLLVRIQGNVEGWVYAYYILANMDINDLDVVTGYGGPNQPAGPAKRGISVVIQYGQASAFVTGVPANEQIVAILAPSSGSGKSLTVTSGWTDAQGNATLVFQMPTTWADGSKVKSGSMTLTVIVDDVTLTAYLTYYTN
jgi:uncharacterized protein YgiM (DUF1202 family)